MVLARPHVCEKSAAPGDRTRARLRRLAFVPLLLLPIARPVLAADAPQLARGDGDLTNLSIEELGNIEVTSVAKKAEPLSAAPAAIYVVTHDDAVSSGAARLPDMLRLAPNLQVAQIAASQHAVTARGFNSAAADKLLVMVDGRTVYTPYFSGVFWDMQDVLPDDLDRIEVVSGPGATLWGANAVNGVINVVTRDSAATQGAVLHAAGGSREGRGSFRYGGDAGDSLTYRAYVDGLTQGHGFTTTGGDARDSWYKVQGGFRTDWAADGDHVTVQGDLYRGSEQQLSSADQSIAGENVLARWTRRTEGGSDIAVQAYFDHVHANIPGLATNDLKTADIDFHHGFSWGSRQEIVWGGGYRLMFDNFPTILSPTQQLKFVPDSRTLRLGNVFIQDTISLTEDFKFIPGIKLEDEPYTGLTALPSARLSWSLAGSNLLWAAVSRAVRVPSRLDRDLTQTTSGVLTVTGGDMQTVKLVAYELGYRAQPSSRASLSVSTFYNVYRDLRSAEPTNGGYPLKFGNGMEGETYGVEVWGNYQITGWWRVTAGFNWLHKDLRFKPGDLGVGGLQIAGNDPATQISLRSVMDVTDTVSIDANLRRIGALPAPASPAYVELGGRVGWAVTDRVELALTGANLLHARHAEFGTTTSALQIGRVGVESGRSVLLEARWRFQ